MYPPHSSAFASKEVIRTAQSDLTPDSTGKLLAIWLALPRLTGTVHRVCTRLRADRSDVEAEMALALLEKLTDQDGASRLTGSSLLHAARQSVASRPGRAAGASLHPGRTHHRGARSHCVRRGGGRSGGGEPERTGRPPGRPGRRADTRPVREHEFPCSVLRIGRR